MYSIYEITPLGESPNIFGHSEIMFVQEMWYINAGFLRGETIPLFKLGSCFNDSFFEMAIFNVC